MTAELQRFALKGRVIPIHPWETEGLVADWQTIFEREFAKIQIAELSAPAFNRPLHGEHICSHAESPDLRDLSAFGIIVGLLARGCPGSDDVLLCRGLRLGRSGKH